MFRVVKTVALVILVAAPAALAASAPDRLPGTWYKLAPAPVVVDESLTSAWTGRQLLIFGRRQVPLTAEDRQNPIFNGWKTKPVNVAALYQPADSTWRRLSPPPGSTDAYTTTTLWTGNAFLLWGHNSDLTFDPAVNQWRPLPRSLPGGLIVWTGREAIGWGGGCCGDASSNGAAYNPATKTFRTLPRSPLGPSQRPTGAWTGRELLLFVSGFDPDGKPLPARLARAAAYNPATNSWRRLAPSPTPGGTAVWDGHELLVVGGGAHWRSALAYNPAANRWTRLAALPYGLPGGSAAWTGRRLLLWGGERGRGLSYDPRTNRWSTVPPLPLRGRSGSAVAWTGRSLIVWGGVIGTPVGTSIPPKSPADGAAFTPARP